MAKITKRRTSRNRTSRITGDKPRDVAPVQAKAPKNAEEVVKRLTKISDMALLWAKTKDRTGVRDQSFRPMRQLHPFDVPETLFNKGENLLAMDSFDTGPTGWAMQIATTAAFEQGLSFLGYPYLAELTQRAEYRRVSEIIATEMTRKWIKLKVSTSDDAEEQSENDEDDQDPKLAQDMFPPSGNKQPGNKSPGNKPGGTAPPGMAPPGMAPPPPPMQQVQKPPKPGEKQKMAKVKELTDYMTELKVKEHFRAMAMYDGFFGRSHLYVDTGDTDNREELNVPIGNGWDAISQVKIKKGSIKAFKPVEAVWCYPLRYNSSNPLAVDWYKPRHWYAMSQEIHASRLLTFVGREVPDLLKPAYSFGGLALSQMVKPTVDFWLRTRKSVNDLIHYFSVFGISTSLMAMLQPGNEEEMVKRAQLFNDARDNRNLLLLDKDTEEAFIQAAPLGTLDVLQAQSLEHICAVAGLPLVKYTGIAPHGLNASSEGEIRVFYDWIEAYQHHLFDTHLHTVIGLCMLSLWGEVDEDITFDYEPLWTLDAAQEAALRKTEAETDEILVGLNALGPIDVRKRVAADPDTPYGDLDVEDLPQMVPQGQEGGPEDIDIKDALKGRPLIPGTPQPGEAESDNDPAGGSKPVPVPSSMVKEKIPA